MPISRGFILQITILYRRRHRFHPGGHRPSRRVPRLGEGRSGLLLDRGRGRPSAVPAGLRPRPHGVDELPRLLADHRAHQHGGPPEGDRRPEPARGVSSRSQPTGTHSISNNWVGTTPLYL